MKLKSVRDSFVSVLALSMLLGCNVLPSFTATATPTITPTPTVTSTPTISVGGTQTAQAQSTATAQSIATRTTQAQATARAQATGTAQAGATATVQAFVAALDAIVQAAPGRGYLSTEGKVDGRPSPYITAFNPDLTLKDFAAQVQFLNPADGSIHPWDYGFVFRSVRPNEYRLIVNSRNQWGLVLINENLADAVNGKTVSSGIVRNLDVSPTGSNTLRLIVRDKSAFLFVNGEFITSIDTSEWTSAGEIYLATALLKGSNFPGLVLRYKSLSIKGLP